jgi:succinate dehydrogenase / fumarate reductase, cytochrome b subunit
MQPVASGSAFSARVPVALSGLLLVLFLVVHLAAVSLAAVAPLRFERLAAGLHASPWLAAAEWALLLVALLHLGLSLVKRLANRTAGNTAALRSRRQGPMAACAAMAARSQAAGGSLLLLFLVVHICQLRLPRPAAGAEREALLAALSHPLSLALYLAAAAALALHLFHGAEAAHRSLGLLDSANGAPIRRVGRSLALLLGGGFALVVLGLVIAPGGMP